MTENPYGEGQPGADQGYGQQPTPHGYGQPQAGSGAGPVGGLGPMPGGNEMRQTQQMQAPADVKTSFTLWIASIVIGVLGVIIGFATTDRDKAVNTIMSNNTSGLTRAQATTAITVGLVVALVIGLILLALEIFFMFKMRAGKNWARIVLTVLGVLSILSGLSGLTQGFRVGTIFSAISLVVVIAAIVFMYKAAAKAYFSTPTPRY